MSKLTKEQYEELPEFLKGDYTEDGDGYSHAGFLKVKGTADNLDKQSRLTKAELEEYRQSEAARIEEAEKKAYEKLKAEGSKDDLESRWSEKLADAERRRAETEAQFKERMAKLATKQKEAIASSLASEYAVKGGKDAYKMLVSRYIDVDPETDEVTYLDDGGSATSFNKADFEEWLKKNPLLQALTKTELTTSGGGNVNGSNSNNAIAKSPKLMSSAERIEFKQRDPAGFKAAFNL